MHFVNVVRCQPDEVLERGAFRFAAYELTERLGAKMIGATVYEMGAGDRCWPYHYHCGVEEWLYVVSGSPLLRDPRGEHTLEPGDLVAFSSGADGAHTVRGPGRVVIFSVGARGWGEAFVTVYPDSDKIGAAPGVTFRRADAIEARLGDVGQIGMAARESSVPGPSDRTVNLTTANLGSPFNEESSGESGVRKMVLGPVFGTQTWHAKLYELQPGHAAAAYHYEWCREEWALVVRGAPILRHADGRTTLAAGDMCCFSEGPAGAHQLLGSAAGSCRLIVFSAPTGRPMSAFFPDHGTVLVSVSDRESFLFHEDDRLEDYWDGEPGAEAPGAE